LPLVFLLEERRGGCVGRVVVVYGRVVGLVAHVVDAENGKDEEAEEEPVLSSKTATTTTSRSQPITVDTRDDDEEEEEASLESSCLMTMMMGNSSIGTTSFGRRNNWREMSV
jgi:hypothetical protein